MPFMCVLHMIKNFKKYLKKIDKVFLKIKECEEGRNINDLLDGPVCKSQFKRLN